MPERAEKLTTPVEVEKEFVKLFDQIDHKVDRYIRSAGNRKLKKQAQRNAVGMLEILKVIYKKDLQSPGLQKPVKTIH